MPSLDDLDVLIYGASIHMNIPTTLQETVSALVADWSHANGRGGVDIPRWILPPRSCDFIKAACSKLGEPVSAFEFGSGRSTHALRAVCQQVVSVEDSADWLDKTEADAGSVARRSSDITAVVNLSTCWNRLRPIESFNLLIHPALLTALQNASLILVDSPPNPAKREHALYQALDHGRDGCLVVVDDLNVGATRRFCERLARQNRSRVAYWHLAVDHEIGVFLKLAPGSINSRPTLREIAGAWMRI